MHGVWNVSGGVFDREGSEEFVDVSRREDDREEMSASRATSREEDRDDFPDEPPRDEPPREDGALPLGNTLRWPAPRFGLDRR